jgi:RecA/RadA recombinase
MANNENPNDFLDNMSKEFNMFTEEPEQITLSNPVLNGMFNGGIPRRSVIQIAAQSGVGKSTLAIQIAKELCAKGENILYIDAEKGLNTSMMTSTGIIKYLNNKNPAIGGRFSIATECDCGAINNLIQKVTDAKAVSFIILDSLGSLDSGIYDVGGTDANNPKVGADTKSIKIIMKTMNKVSIKHNTGFICINHMAQSIGTYIPQENPTGGRAPIYLSDIVIALTKKSSEFEKQNLGQKVEFEAKKSRRGAGKTKVPFYIRFGQGIAMIPTYREVLEEIMVPYQGSMRPALEIRGGGNGSLFIKDEEFKFRGEAQLMKLISANYSYIKSIVPWKTFEVQPIKSDIYDIDEPDFNSSSIDISTDEEDVIPEDLADLEVVKRTVTDIYFRDGIDATGQEYYIAYNIKDGMISLYFDGQESVSSNDLSKSNFNKLDKKLQSYLKKCEKEMN